MGALIKFSYDECIKARGILGKNPYARSVWGKHFSPSTAIGHDAMLYKRLYPESYEDFYEKYVRYAEENIHEQIRYRGLTENELLKLAEDYKNYTEELDEEIDEDADTYLADALCHIIVETYDGMEMERRAFKILEKAGLNPRYPHSSYDNRYGIDIMIENPANGQEFGVQVKPASFFFSNKPDSVIDRRLLCEKYEKAKAEKGIKTYYMIYNRRGDTKRFVKNRGGYRFKINELFEYDRDDIKNTVKYIGGDL